MSVSENIFEVIDRNFFIESEYVGLVNDSMVQDERVSTSEAFFKGCIASDSEEIEIFGNIVFVFLL